MANLNKVFMIGRLTKDPELRYLPNGTPKADLRLATSREWKDRNGERQKDVCYIDVVVWSRQAEIVKQYLSKGRQIFVEGRIDFQEWEKDGQRRSKHQIIADRVQFLDRGGDENQGSQYAPSYESRQNSGGGGGGGGGGYAPYGGKTYGGKTYGGNAYEGPQDDHVPHGAPMNEAMGVPDSDLPF